MNWFMVIVGAALTGVGWWGWRNVKRLVPRGLSAESRLHQEGVLQRGSAMLLFVGVLFEIFAVYAMIMG